jgi:hypothetical protein
VASRLTALLILLGSCGESASPPADASVDRGGMPDTGEPPDRPPDRGGSDLAADAPVADAPVACAVTEPRSRWATWPIPHPGAGTNAHSYDLGSPGVVVDRVTGLVWQRALDEGMYTWAEATSRCACLSLGGHEDWRLPTRMELVSIVDFTRDSPAIDPVAFPQTTSEWFWTSSRRADDPSLVWYIYFETGFTNFVDEDQRYRVRCLRDPAAAGDASVERYRVDNGTVLDRATGLTWQRTVEEAMHTNAEAKAYCAGLPFAGGGWRLPSMKELQSLVDDSRANPAIDDSAFPDVPMEPFWTATPVVGFPGSAWRVSFAHGYTYDAKEFYPYLARCVR